MKTALETPFIQLSYFNLRPQKYKIILIGARGVVILTNFEKMLLKKITAKKLRTSKILIPVIQKFDK